MLFPATTVAGPLLVIETSALVETVVLVVELLLPGLPSEVVDATVAVLLIVVPLGVEIPVWTTSVNVAEAPAAKVAREQETVAPVVHVNAGPLFCASETNEVPAGNTSVQLTLVAFEGPALATVTV